MTGLYIVVIKYYNSLKSVFVLFFSAAHCISGPGIKRKRAKLISVRLGEHNLDENPDCVQFENGGQICAPPVVNILTAETIVHEKYTKSFSSYNDIALIRLAKSISFSEWVKPICLPIAKEIRNKNFRAKPLVVAGFGSTIECMFELNYLLLLLLTD